MASIAEKLMTADEFFALPDNPSGGKAELIEGRVTVMSPVGEEHMDVSMALVRAIDAFVRSRNLGKVGFELGFHLHADPDTVRGPDVPFISHDRLPRGRDRRKFVRGALNLPVGVVSPTDREDELLRKVGDHLHGGSGRVWVVRPKLRAVTVYCAGGNVTTFGAAATLTSGDAGFDIPGLGLPVASLFEELDS